MTRTLRAAAAVTGLVALFAVPASAQQRGFGGGMGGGPALLTNKSVQKELKVEDDQKPKLAKLAEELSAKQREAFQGLQNVAQDERRAKMAEITKSINSDTDKGLADILKADQIKRFHQIRLQVRGADAFNDAEVKKKLALTDDQKSKVTAMMTDMRTQMREIFQGAQDDREGAMKKMTALRKETTDKAVALLTNDQKKTWKEMTGETFEYVPEPPPAR
jgi:Spy/CpxP family protein refolding chaperone